MKRFEIAVLLLCLSALSALSGCSREPVVHRGDVVIDEISDIEKYSGFTHIEGDLTIGLYTAPHVVSFPALVEVNGSVEMWSSAVHVLRFDELRKVGGTFRVAANEKLEEIHAPELKSIGAFLGVMTNRKLATLDFSSLESVEDRADISLNSNLTTCEMEKIRKGLAKNEQFFYYYENKADSCKDHQFRYDEFYRMKKSENP